MNENDDDNDLIVTAIFEDNTRKRYFVPNDTNADRMSKLIIQDPTITKPSNNFCLVREGHILEKDEKISSGSQSKEFSLNIVFNPFLSGPRAIPRSLAAFLGGLGNDIDDPSIIFDDSDDAAIILDERTLGDLADIFPQLFGAGREGEYNFCGWRNLKKFLIGFVIGIFMGPLALIVLPCYDFDLSGILGISLGVIIWVLLILVFANGKRHTSKRRIN